MTDNNSKELKKAAYDMESDEITLFFQLIRVFGYIKSISFLIYFKLESDKFYLAAPIRTSNDRDKGKGYLRIKRK